MPKIKSVFPICMLTALVSVALSVSGSDALVLRCHCNDGSCEEQSDFEMCFASSSGSCYNISVVSLNEDNRKGEREHEGSGVDFSAVTFLYGCWASTDDDALQDEGDEEDDSFMDAHIYHATKGDRAWSGKSKLGKQRNDIAEPTVPGAESTWMTKDGRKYSMDLCRDRDYCNAALMDMTASLGHRIVKKSTPFP